MDQRAEGEPRHDTVIPHRICLRKVDRRRLLRPAQALAARIQREHQRAAAPLPAKGTDLSVHPAADLARIARSLNNRPRKTHGYITPSETLAELLTHTG
jgi:hypothetical protein